MTSFPIPPNYAPGYAEHILVASPSTVVRRRVLESLRSPVRRFEQASGGAEALVHLESGSWQVLVLDRHLPDLDAEELSHTVRQRYPGIEVVLLDPELDSELDSKSDSKSDAESEPEEKADLLREMWPAAFPVDKNENQHQENDQGDAADEVVPAACAAQSILEAPLPGMIGNSRIMQPVYRLGAPPGPAQSPRPPPRSDGLRQKSRPRAIHQLSPRAGRAFAVVNCAAI